ncbi:2366_t:CDS:1, partial [Racocetra fulgida]
MSSVLKQRYNQNKKPNETFDEFKERWYKENYSTNFPKSPQENESPNQQNTSIALISTTDEYIDAPTSPTTIITNNPEFAYLSSLNNFHLEGQQDELVEYAK